MTTWKTTIENLKKLTIANYEIYQNDRWPSRWLLRSTGEIIWEHLRFTGEMTWKLLKFTWPIGGENLRWSGEMTWKLLRSTGELIWEHLRFTVEMTWKLLRSTGEIIWEHLMFTCEMTWKLLKLRWPFAAMSTGENSWWPLMFVTSELKISSLRLTTAVLRKKTLGIVGGWNMVTGKWWWMCIDVIWTLGLQRPGSWKLGDQIETIDVVTLGLLWPYSSKLLQGFTWTLNEDGLGLHRPGSWKLGDLNETIYVVTLGLLWPYSSKCLELQVTPMVTVGVSVVRSNVR
jgi:hypothetical protein